MHTMCSTTVATLHLKWYERKFKKTTTVFFSHTGLFFFDTSRHLRLNLKKILQLDKDQIYLIYCKIIAIGGFFHDCILLGNYIGERNKLKQFYNFFQSDLNLFSLFCKEPFTVSSVFMGNQLLAIAYFFLINLIISFQGKKK